MSEAIMSEDRRTEVVVVGAGPVGLLLAAELRLGGAAVTVLERLTDIDQTIKAGAVNLPTAEIFQRRGLWPAVQRAQAETQERLARFLRELMADAQDGQAPAAARPPRRIAGHFGGIMLDAALFDPRSTAFAGRDAANALVLVSQQQVETFLGERADELGVRVLRGVAFDSFTEDGDGVTVHCDDGTALRAHWLVGCDGGRSRVRKLAGFDFPGTDPEITAYQAMLELSGTEDLPGGWHDSPTGVYVFGPIPGRILVARFDAPPVDRDAPISAEELQDAIRHVTGVAVTVNGIHSATRFTDNARQSSTYRRGRVLLAGDAAHVHSPFGGQGLNLGLGDAMNLGWKLAAVCRQDAGTELLDTYTAERHPIGRWVLDWTRAQISIMRPDEHARAMRAVLKELLATEGATTYVATRLSGVWQRYDLGDARHPLTGASAPELEFADGTRLAEHLQAGKAVLVDTAKRYAHLAAGYEDRLIVVNLPYVAEAEEAGPDAGERPGPAPAALLVRPDGFVAWAADAGDTATAQTAATAATAGTAGADDPADDDADALATALHSWLGAAK
jgi:2-polyprenyl-6-methoxyphenol hydroxylase-like FAD-dependent oxidoreductase